MTRTVLLTTKQEVINFIRSFKYDIEIDDTQFFPKVYWLGYGELLIACLNFLDGKDIDYYDFIKVLGDKLTSNVVVSEYLVRVGNEIILKQNGIMPIGEVKNGKEQTFTII